MICSNLVAAESDEQAEYLSTSLKKMMMGIITKEREPLSPPLDDMDSVWNPRQKAAIEQMLSRSLIGGRETVKSQLEELLEDTLADEIMVISHLYDHQKSLNSYRIFSEIMKEHNGKKEAKAYDSVEQ